MESPTFASASSSTAEWVEQLDLKITDILDQKISVLARALNACAADDLQSRDRIRQQLAQALAAQIELASQAKHRDDTGTAEVATASVAEGLEQVSSDDRQEIVSFIKTWIPVASATFTLGAGVGGLATKVIELMRGPAPLPPSTPSPQLFGQYLPAREYLGAQINPQRSSWKTLRRGQRLSLLGYRQGKHSPEVAICRGIVALTSSSDVDCPARNDSPSGTELTIVSSRNGCVVYSQSDTLYIKAESQDDFTTNREVLNHLTRLQQEGRMITHYHYKVPVIAVLFQGFDGTRCQRHVVDFHPGMDMLTVNQLVDAGFAKTSR